MERVALHVQPRHGGVQEAQIEAAVVADQDRAFAAIGFQRLAHATEDVGQCSLFTHCHAQWVIELDARKFQSGGFDIRAFERLDAEEVGVFREHETLFIHADGGRGDFQQCVGSAVETTGFYVDDNRQIATKPLGHRVTGTATAVLVFVVVMVFTHLLSSSRRQRSVSPARSGMTVSSPNGRLAGAVQSSRTRVMRSVFAGRP